MITAILAAAIVATVATAWFRPSWLKSFASFLVRFADATQAARAVFQATTSIPTPSKKALAPISFTQDQADVVSALVNSGLTEKQAAKKVTAAISGLPASAGFDAIWRKAVAA